MSGTNISRMVTGCDKLDGYVQSTYMALEQTQKDIVKRSYVKLQLDKLQLVKLQPSKFAPVKSQSEKS